MAVTRTVWLGSLGSTEALSPDSLNVNVLPHLSLSKPHIHIVFFLSDPFGNRLQTRVPRVPKHFLVYFFLFIYLWLLWVFAPAHTLSPVVTSEGCSLVVVCGFLIVLASVVVEHGL